INPGTGVISGTLPYTAAGSYNVTVTASDGTLSGNTDFTWAVANTNRAPTVTNPGNQTSTEGGSVSLQVVASDPDGDTLTYSATGLPSGLSISATTGLISGTLAAGSAGSYSVTVSTSDGTLSDSKTFTWQVNGTGAGFQLGRFVAFSTENTWLRSKSKIITGDVGANTSIPEKDRKHREDEEDDDDDDKDNSKDGDRNKDREERGNERDKRVEVRIGEHVEMLESASRVVGDTVWLRNDSSVYSVYYNELIKSKSADILGGKYKPLSLPVLSLPALPTITPGTQDIEVKQRQSVTLAAGAYRKITVQNGGTLILTGGLYQVSALDIRTETKVLFKAKSEVRVKNEMDSDAKTYIGPDPSLPNLKAHDIVFYIGGADDKGRKHDDDHDKDKKDEEVSPTVVQIGVKNILLANIYAPNGTVWLKEETKGTGAFIGKQVRIGEKAELKLDNAF
ncbi:MAG: Ig domain-containing protein, partial [Dehalococcoidia bacterium]|nr:Ig domain-containing protein [Dehalococcoidia bacterium]